MKLTKQTDFAFRTLLYLADQPPGKLSSIQEVCDFFGLSPNHISKVVMRLVRMGYLETVRGKGGGIRLGKAPGEIPLIEVVAEFETTLRPINCGEQPCRIIRSCKLKGVLDQAMQAFLNTLAPYTLADMVQEKSDIQVLSFQ